MPTQKPRITITLTEHQYEVLRRMSVLGGESMSSIVVDMLDTMVPVLERVVVTLQAAIDAPQQVREGMKSTFQKAEKELLPQLTSMMGQLDMLLQPAVVPALAGASAGAVAVESPRPPATNRGVRNTSKRLKTGADSPMKTASKPRGVRK